MDDSKGTKIKKFWEDRAKKESFLWKDFTSKDLELVKKFMVGGGLVLDLGGGDGRLLKEIEYAYTGGVIVDYVKPVGLKVLTKVKFVQEDLKDYKTDKRYKTILLFGVANSLSDKDLEELYQKVYSWLDDDGVLIVKHQCSKGEQELLVDKYSDELKAEYVAVYRTIRRDVSLLKRAGLEVQIESPYTQEMSNWANTEYRAFIGRRGKRGKFFMAMLTRETYQQLKRDWEVVSTDQKVDREQYKQNLLRAKEVLDEAEIPFMLMYGTLLGAVREKNFLEWDRDTDIAILDKFQTRLIEVVEQGKFEPLKLLRAEHNFMSLTHKGAYIDVYSFVDVGEDKYLYCGGIQPYYNELRSVVENMSKIEFLGTTFNTVENPEKQLERWYGKDWRVPKRNCLGSVEFRR